MLRKVVVINVKSMQDTMRALQASEVHFQRSPRHFAEFGQIHEGRAREVRPPY